MARIRFQSVTKRYANGATAVAGLDLDIADQEFLVLLERTPLEGGVVMAERIRNAMLVREVRNARGESLPGVTLSVGIATAGDRETLSGVIGAADAQLYRAKRGGRNRICF